MDLCQLCLPYIMPLLDDFFNPFMVTGILLGNIFNYFLIPPFGLVVISVWLDTQFSNFLSDKTHFSDFHHDMII